MGLFDNLKAGIKGFGQGFKSSVEANRATGEGFTDYRGTFDAQGARVPGTDKPNLLQLAQGAMTDNRGLFQGGQDGRMFGRYRDFADKVNASGSGLTLPGGKIPSVPNQKGAVTTINTPDGESVTRYADPTDEARAFATTFDPSNPEEVFKMQSLLRNTGMMDFEGNPIATDSQWGYKSQSALDFLRSGKYKPNSSYGVNEMGIQEDLLLDQPSPIMNANASNDFMGDRFGYGVSTADTNNMINSGPGRTPEQAMLNQIR